jgi:ribonuclease BN (tRNA processing enzyme)
LNKAPGDFIVALLSPIELSLQTQPVKKKTMVPSRRNFLTGAASAFITGRLILPRVHGQERKRTRLILLGTKGGPRILGDRSGPSTLILINDVPYVIDCGQGTARQLVSAGVALDRLRYLFFTHLHSDHMIDYGPVFYHGWAAGLKSRVDAYGPPPLSNITRAYWEYMKFDVETRIEDEGRPDPRTLLVANEFVKPGILMQNADVLVTAATVRHPPIQHAYGYRFDTADRSIVISGDTTYSPELVALAKGADVLVHEVLYPPALDTVLARTPNAATLRKHLVESHSTPEDVGRVAFEAQVKTVVLSHLVPGDDPAITDDMWTEGVRKQFQGPVVVGKDLMEF